MAVYRNISLSFWTDSKVDESFTPEDKYFYLYLLTNPHTNLCGCYEISKRQMSIETGYNIETVTHLLERFEKVHGVIRYDYQTRELLVINWSKYNWTRSQKFLKAVNRDKEMIKNTSFRQYVDNLINGYGISNEKYPMDTTVSVSVSDTVTDTVSVSDTEREKKREKTRKVLEEAHNIWLETRGNK